MRIKFVNLNIWYGQLLPSVLEFLKQESPDIVSLQEVYNGQGMPLAYLNSWGIIKSTLEYKYTSFAPAFYVMVNETKVDQGQAVLSKYPILSQEVLFYDVAYGEFVFPSEDFSLVPRNLQHVILDIQNKELNVFNTQGIWGSDHIDNERRIAMSRKIVDQIKSRNHVILSGDFNVTPETKTIRIIEDNLQNPFRGKLITTINPKRMNPSLHEGNPVLDMVFVSPDIRIIDAYCPQVDVSDHVPLVIVFEI